MTAAELNAALSRLGWTGARLARRLAVSERQVSKWRRGRAPVPGPAAEAVRLLLLAKEMLDG